MTYSVVNVRRVMDDRKPKQECCRLQNAKLVSYKDITVVTNYTYYCDVCHKTFTEFEPIIKPVKVNRIKVR